MQILDANGKWQRCDAARIRAELKHGQQARRAYAANRGKAGALDRAMDIAIRRSERSDRIARTTMKRVERELGLLDHHSAWGKPLTIRLPRRARQALKKAVRSATKGLARPLPGYRKALRDKRGRVAVFMRIRYMGFKSPKWADGCAAEHVIYILRDPALNADGTVAGWLSNIGEDAAEIADAWKVLEEVEKGYRSNAIVQYRVVVNLPHELDAAQQQKLVETFCERTFGRLGLPYVAAIHRPDAEGDERNYHAHICFSMRPVERTGPFEWRIAQEKVNQLTDPDGLKLMRAQFTAITNLALRKAGLLQRFTHQAYAERGINAQRTEHNGPARTAAYRRGESVGMVRTNALLINRNEAADDVRIAEKRCELAERRDALAERLAKAGAQRDRLARLHQLVQSIEGAGRKARAQVRKAPTSAINVSLEIRRSLALAIRQRAERVADRLGRAITADGSRSVLADERLRAEKLKQKAAVAEAAMRRVQSDAAFAERLRVLREVALDMARSAAVDAAKKTTRENAASIDAGVAAHRSIRMNGVKENAAAPQPADACVVDGEALIRRLQAERVYLVLEDDGVVAPHDRKALSEAELSWLKSNQLSAMGVRQDQQQEIAKIAEHVEAHIDDFRNGTLKVDEDFNAAWHAFAAAPEIQRVIAKNMQQDGEQREIEAAIGVPAPAMTSRRSPVSPGKRDKEPEPALPTSGKASGNLTAHAHAATMAARERE